MVADRNALRSALEGLPLNRHLGLKVLSVRDGKAEVELPWADELLNHVGTQHAASLFAVGEAASGGVVLGSFAEVLETFTPLARRAEVKYRAPARGPVRAIASLEAEKERVLDLLGSKGRVEFPVRVELVDEKGARVASMTVYWYLLALDARAEDDGLQKASEKGRA